jgi:hypothetical protein
LAPKIEACARQAEEYVQRAEALAARFNWTNDERPVHLGRRGQIAQFRGEWELAKRLFTDSAELFEANGDHRAERIRNRLVLLERMRSWQSGSSA